MVVVEGLGVIVNLLLSLYLLARLTPLQLAVVVRQGLAPVVGLEAILYFLLQRQQAEVEAVITLRLLD